MPEQPRTAFMCQQDCTVELTIFLMISSEAKLKIILTLKLLYGRFFSQTIINAKIYTVGPRLS